MQDEVTQDLPSRRIHSQEFEPDIFCSHRPDYGGFDMQFYFVVGETEFKLYQGIFDEPEVSFHPATTCRKVDDQRLSAIVRGLEARREVNFYSLILASVYRLPGIIHPPFECNETQAAQLAAEWIEVEQTDQTLKRTLAADANGEFLNATGTRCRQLVGHS